MESAEEREGVGSAHALKRFSFCYIAPSSGYTIFKQRVNRNHQKICCLHAHMLLCIPVEEHATQWRSQGWASPGICPGILA